jgi:hypothetical protein
MTTPILSLLILYIHNAWEWKCMGVKEYGSEKMGVAYPVIVFYE